MAQDSQTAFDELYSSLYGGDEPMDMSGMDAAKAEPSEGPAAGMPGQPGEFETAYDDEIAAPEDMRERTPFDQLYEESLDPLTHWEEVGENIKAVGAGALGVAASIPSTLGRVLPEITMGAISDENWLLQAGEAMHGVATETMAPDWRQAMGPAGEFRGKLMHGYGSMLGFAGTAGLGGGMKAVAAVGAAAGFDEVYRDAKAHGEEDADAFTAALAGAAVGTTEAIPIGRIFSRANKATGGAFSALLKSVAQGAAEEGTQEFIDQALKGMIAEGINPLNMLDEELGGYDKDREILSEALEGGLIGAITGGHIGGTATALQMKTIMEQQKAWEDAKKLTGLSDEELTAQIKLEDEARADAAKAAPKQADFAGAPVDDVEPSVRPKERTERPEAAEDAETLKTYRERQGAVQEAHEREAQRVEEETGLEPQLPEDLVKPEARVVEPETTEEEAVQGWFEKRGMRTVFVEGGAGGSPAMYSGGTVLWNVDAPGGLRAESFRAHETSHHVEAVFKEDANAVWEQIKALDPVGVAWSEDAYATAHRTETGTTLPEDAKSDEGRAYYAEMMSGWLRFMRQNPDTAQRMAQDNPGFMAKIADVLKRVLNSIRSVFGKDPKYKSWDQNRREAIKRLADLPIRPDAPMRGLSVEEAAKVAESLKELLDLSLGTAPQEEAAREAAPAPEGEQAQEKPAQVAERPPEAVPPTDAKKTGPKFTPDAHGVKKLTPGQIRRAKQKANKAAKREERRKERARLAAAEGQAIVGDKPRSAQERRQETPETAAEKATREWEEGRDRFALAPPVGSDAFAAWFQDSKVVDADGKPLVVYHGTREKFTEFDPDRAIGTQFWFTTSRELIEKGEVGAQGRGVIMEVYLSIQNPAGRSEYDKFGIGELISKGYDGLALVEDDETTYVAFDPTQIKSAVENRGTYSPTDPDIRHALVGAPYFEDWRAQEETFTDHFVRNVVDRLRKVKQLGDEAEKRGIDLDDSENPYLKAMLRTSKTRRRLDKLNDNYIAPLLKLLGENGLRDIQYKGAKRSMVSEWLIARTSQDKNRVVRERSEGKNNAGSGMTDAEALEVLDHVSEHALAEQFAEIGRLFDGMNQDKIGGMVADHLLSQSHADWLNEAYPHYAPTKSMEDSEMGSWVGKVGRGFRAQGKEFQQMFGRATPATDPIEFAIAGATAAIVRGEKNLVGVALARLLRKAGEDTETAPWVREVGQINLPMKRKVLVRKKGKKGETPENLFPDQPDQTTDAEGQTVIREMPDFNYKNQPNVYVFKENGEEKVLTFNAAYLPLAQAMNTMNAPQMHKAVAAASSVMRTWAALRTRWNPAFGPFNLWRDVGLGVSFHGVLHGKESASRIFMGTRQAWMVLRGKKSKTGLPEKYEKEMRDSGAPISVYGLETVEEIVKDIDRAVKESKPGGAPNRMRKLGRFLLNYLEEMNDNMENATRFSAYIEAREHLGMTAEQAAYYAKDFTVNFEQKGAVGPHLNTAYPFLNAQVQGLDKMYRVAKAEPKAFKKLIGGLVTLGAIQQILGMTFTDDDEDGETFFSKVPEYKLNYGLMLPIDGKNMLSLPLPYVLNSFVNLGRNITAVAVGEKPVGKAAWDTSMSFLDSTSPMGPPDQFTQFVIPTAFDPMIQIALNEDWKGDPIGRKNLPWGVQKPDSELYFKHVNPFFREFASWSNRFLGGGDRVTPGSRMYGWFDVNPENIEHTYEAITGSAGATLHRTLAAIGRGATGGFEPHATPLVRRFLYQPSPYEAVGRVYDTITEIGAAKARIKAAQEDKRFDDAREYRKEYRGILRMEASGKALKKRLTTLGERIDAAEGEKKQQLEDQRQSVAKRWLKRVKEARD